MAEIKKASLEPLLVRIAPGLDVTDFEESDRLHEDARNSYDPLTQTSSDHEIFAGSHKTYDPSFSGLFASKDDSRVSDW